MAKAVFFDRDETLNPDTGYISNPNHFHLFPWVPDALARLKKAGFLLVLVSNQSGVNRGHILPEQLQAIHEKLTKLLFDEAKIKIDDFAICPHRPEENCECRKPKPKLILDSAKKLGVVLKESFLIGDRESDFLAGQAAGLKKSFWIKPSDRVSFMAAVEEILTD